MTGARRGKATALQADDEPAAAGTGRRATRLMVGAALGLAVVAYAVALAGRLPGFLERKLPSSDTISPVLLVKAIASPNHGAIYLGNHPGYSDLLVSALGLRFPNPMLSPQAVTYAVYLVGAVILGWTVRRCSRWSAAILTVLIAALASPWLLFEEASPAGRVTSLTNLAVLGWLLVSLAGSPKRSLPTLTTAVLGAGLISGIDAVSDPLFAAVGLVPFLVTGLALWARRHDRRSALVAGAVTATIVVTAVCALITLGVSHSLGLQTPVNHIRLAPLREIAHNLHIVGGASGAAAGQFFASLGSGMMSYVETAVGLLVVAAVLAALVSAGRALLRPVAAKAGEGAVVAHRMYWALVASLDLAAVLVSSYAADITAIRYLTPLWLALAALLPLALGRRPVARMALAVAVAALAAADAASFASLPLPAPAAKAPLVVSLEAAQITRAYADYWDANLVTWATNGRITVDQVAPCSGDAAHLCPFHINSVSAWFRPTAGPVAVVIDPRFSLRDPPSPTYGAPERVLRVAGGVTIYVYPHDLRLGA